MAERSPPLSVIVPATNLPPTLGAVCAALRPQLLEGDELVAITQAPGPGPGWARNHGAADARGEVLVFVDADVVVAPDALARIRRAFAVESDLVAVFGAYDSHPAASDLVSGFRNLLHHHVHVAAAGPALTFWAGLGAIRRADFEAVGGFDVERFREPSIEDVELGMRISDRGGKIVLDPAICGTHLKRWTLRSMLVTDFAKRGVPWVRLLSERRGAAAAAAEEVAGDAEMRVLNLSRRHRAGALAAVAVAVAALARAPRALLASLGLLVALNAGFYRLLVARLGARGALVGLGLHLAHHFAAVAAVPFGLAAARRGQAGR